MLASSTQLCRLHTFAGMAFGFPIRRWLSPTLFALIGLCFFLPFATVSCDDAKTTFTAAQLVTQTVPRGGVLDEGDRCSRDISDCAEASSSAGATVALLAAALGSLLAAFGVARGGGSCAAVGLIATVDLAMPAFSFEGPEIDFHAGYFAMLLLFLAVAVILVIRRALRAAHGEPGDVFESPRSDPARLLVTLYWTFVCAVLLTRYDFSPTSRFALMLFVGLLLLVGSFLVRVVRDEVRFWRRDDLDPGRHQSIQG